MNLSSRLVPIESISDEDYLVFRAKQAQVHDKAEAKAWLITARTLFPNNFKIQFEAYCMHKENDNVQEAARNLEFVLRNFPNEELVWREVTSIIEALRADEIDAQRKLLKDMYIAMPVDVQRLMLLSVAEKSNDIIEHCKLLIMMLERFKECIPQYGVRLVEDLLSAEKRAFPDYPVNSLRKLLICDILPLVLSSSSIDFSQKQLLLLLHQGIEFCLYSFMKPAGRDEMDPHNTWDKNLISKSPWTDLGVVLDLIGRFLGWELKDLLKTNNWQVQRQRLHSLCNLGVHGVLDDKSSYNQIFYCATILFLRGFCEYISIIDPSQIVGSTGDRLCSAVLVEGLRNSSNGIYDRPVNDMLLNRSKPKKMKLEEDKDECDSPLTISNQIAQDGSLSHSFLTAVRCWDILHRTETLATDFARFCQRLSIDSWLCFQNFQIDILIYKGLFTEAVQWLSKMPIPNVAGYREKISLQAACCHYQLEDYVIACRKVMDVVCWMTESQPITNWVVENTTVLSKPVRHLIFISITMTDVLHYCIKLLVTRLRDVVRTSGINDTAVGHLLVLLQYDWPNEETLFMEIIELIKRRGTLTYCVFFNYLTNIDILEEFAHLSLPVGGNLVFNFLPASDAQNSKQRTVTRGVNKGVKEDFRAAMEKQVSRCDENIISILVNFLIQERNTLFQNVHNARPIE